MTHTESLQKNVQNFKKDALKYDSIPAMQVLTDLFTLSMIQFPDPDQPPTQPSNQRPILQEHDISLQLQHAHQVYGNSTKSSFLLRENATVVDFACGTGLVASKIAPYISKGRIVGIDISEAMLAEFDAKAAALGSRFPDLDVSSVLGDVLDPSFDMAPLSGIADVLVCSLAFHHLHNYNEVAAKLKQMVKPGGWILIYDFYNEDQEKPVQAATEMGVSRHGVTLDEMRSSLADGCDHVSSEREYRVEVWHELPFIESHCCDDVKKNLGNAPRKGDYYLVSTSIILGAARKSPASSSRD